VLVVYCLVSDPSTPDLSTAPPGLPDAAPPRVVALGRERWLLAADAPATRFGEAALERGLRDAAWVSTCALAHERFIEHFLGAAALLPMKLFTVFSSEQAAVAAMQRGARRTSALLRRLAGHVECGVRVRLASSLAPASAPRSTGNGAGRAFLEAKKAARDARHAALAEAAAGAARLDQELRGRSADARALAPPPGATPLLLDVAYLVPRNGVARFEQALADGAPALAALGCETTLTGPWPAYHFLEPA
jgi:hypothetical protein